MSDLVSIIMPNYNSARFIEESINSVINQTYKNWELIICDDNSTDNSKDIAKNYESGDQRIKVIQNKFKKGAPGARNSCIEFSSGKYIAFLDSDDIWYPNKLDLQVSFMKDNNYDFVYSYHDLINESGVNLGFYKAPIKVNSSNMKFSNFIPCLTAIYDSNSIGKVFQPYVEKRNDFALWLKILNSGAVKNAYCLPIATAKYRTNTYGLSSNKLDSLRFFRLVLIKFGNTSPIKSYFYSVIYLFIILFKKKFRFLYNLIVVKF